MVDLRIVKSANCEVRAFSLSSRVAVFLVLLIGACTYVYSFLWHTSVSRPSGSSLMLRSRTVGVSSRCGLYWNTLGLWERRATATVSAIIVGTYSPSYLLFILPAPSAPDSVAHVSSTSNPSHLVDKLRMVLTGFQTQMESRKSEVRYNSCTSSSSLLSLLPLFPPHILFPPHPPPLPPPSSFPFLSFSGSFSSSSTSLKHVIDPLFPSQLAASRQEVERLSTECSTYKEVVTTRTSAMAVSDAIVHVISSLLA